MSARTYATGLVPAWSVARSWPNEAPAAELVKVLSEPDELLSRALSDSAPEVLVLDAGRADFEWLSALVQFRLMHPTLPWLLVGESPGTLAPGLVRAEPEALSHLVRHAKAQPAAKPLPALLSFLEQATFDGSLELISNQGNMACIWFSMGAVSYAESLDEAGADALTQILSWQIRSVELRRDSEVFLEALQTPSTLDEEGLLPMKTQETTQLLRRLSDIDGYIASALVSADSGMVVAKDSTDESFNLEMAAATNTEVVKAKIKAIQKLGLEDKIEDILITLGRQYHLIRPLSQRPEYFFYLAVDRARANLALSRMGLEDVERRLDK